MVREKRGLFSRRRLILTFAVVAALWGGGRVYYALTDGFLEVNIYAEGVVATEERLLPPTAEEMTAVFAILEQPFDYLGKGCQSYVFASRDGAYVLKLLKYHRFRTKWWVDLFSFIPAVERHRARRAARKEEKLGSLLNSWKVAANSLREESGVLFVHLEKGQLFERPLILYDKLGKRHAIDLNKCEFLLQRRVRMLGEEIEARMARGEEEEVQGLLRSIVELLHSEYDRGIIDNDHALMQNTGVLAGRPIQIDVGQFFRVAPARSRALYKQHLFNKTYKFRHWLSNHYPSLQSYLEVLLFDIIGEEMERMQPHCMG